MNVLSLFDGKSSGYTAMELAGIPVTKYYSSEIDRYAIKVSNAIHPNQTRLGDVTKWREWDIDWASIDLVIAGSPCQGFSFAGKQLAFDDPRSKLFFVFVDILNHVKSLNKNVKFLLENVKMKKEYMDVIDHQLGVESIMINSALVSAQNRKRLYWTNIPCDQPIDRSVIISDIIESGVVDKHKSYCIDANYFKEENLNSYFEKHRRKLVFCQPCRVSERGRRLNVWGTRNDKHGEIVRGYEGSDDGKTSCLTTVQKDNYLLQDYIVRKLTPRECFRLQTVPEHYIDKILTCGVSNSQLYKIAGNGWTDEVIAHILRGIKS